MSIILAIKVGYFKKNYMNFPYTLSPKNLEKFFTHIQQAGIPSNVTRDYLGKSGFRSSNDRNVVPILKFIKFLDSSGVPTKQWRDYRNKSRAKGILANAVREAYGDLFSTFSDAQNKDNEALQNYFRGSTAVGDRVLRAMVSTFQTLCSLGDFKMEIEPPVKVEPVEKVEVVTEQVKSDKGLTLNINIQLQLPETKDASIYEKLFAALKKHLMSD